MHGANSIRASCKSGFLLSHGPHDRVHAASSRRQAAPRRVPVRDDAASLASRSSAVIFFLGLPRRLVAHEMLACALVQLQQNGGMLQSVARSALLAAAVAIGARTRPARTVLAPRSLGGGLACSSPSPSRRHFAQDPWGLPTPGKACANGLLQLQRSAAATCEAAAASGHGLARHSQYACAHVCATRRACEGREGRPRPQACMAMLVCAVRIGSL